MSPNRPCVSKPAPCPQTDPVSPNRPCIPEPGQSGGERGTAQAGCRHRGGEGGGVCLNFKPFLSFPPLFYSDFPLPFGSGWLTRGGVPPKRLWDPPSLAQPAGRRRGPGLTPRLSQLATGPSCGPLAPAAPTPPHCCPTGCPVPRSIPPRPHGSRIPSPWQPSHPPRVPQIAAPPPQFRDAWELGQERVCTRVRASAGPRVWWACVGACGAACTRVPAGIRGGAAKRRLVGPTATRVWMHTHVHARLRVRARVQTLVCACMRAPA